MKRDQIQRQIDSINKDLSIHPSEELIEKRDLLMSQLDKGKHLGDLLFSKVQEIQNAATELEDAGPWVNPRVESCVSIILQAAEILEGESIGKPALGEGLVTGIRDIVNDARSWELRST